MQQPANAAEEHACTSFGRHVAALLGRLGRRPARISSSVIGQRSSG